MSKDTKKQDLVMSRIFDAPVAHVWQAWHDPDLIKQWWGPDGFTAPIAEIDFREGSTSLVCMSSPQFGENYSTWHYLEILPMEHITYIHNLADKDGNKIDPVAIGMPSDFPQDQRHQVVFKALTNNQTELTITEYGWTVGQMMELSQMGMEQCLEKMAKALSQIEA